MADLCDKDNSQTESPAGKRHNWNNEWTVKSQTNTNL